MNPSLRLITEQTGKRFQKISKPNGKPKPTRQARGEGFKKNQPLYGLTLAKIGVARTKVDIPSINDGTRNIIAEAQSINVDTRRFILDAQSTNDVVLNCFDGVPSIKVDAQSCSDEAVRFMVDALHAANHKPL